MYIMRSMSGVLPHNMEGDFPHTMLGVLSPGSILFTITYVILKSHQFHLSVLL